MTRKGQRLLFLVLLAALGGASGCGTFGQYLDLDPRAVRLEVRPAEATDQVRTQHVLIATLYDENNVPVRNRRIEWSLSGVGHILDADHHGYLFECGSKKEHSNAVSYTSGTTHRVTRGTTKNDDDFMINPGQSWCVVTSPVEGDTYVTVYAPGIYNWDKRAVTVNVRWADVAWEFPPPAQVRGGAEHVFTTRVFKATDRLPLAKYRVRYKIIDGPAAFFLPTRTTEFVATSNLDGAAQVAIVQPAAAYGVNKISIEIIRPPDPTAPSGAGVPIAKGETSIEWLAPNVQLLHTGPAIAVLNEEVIYDTKVTNAGRIESRSQTLAMVIPDGLQYVRSNPPAFVEGKQLVWALGILPTGGTHNIQAVFKSLRAGNVTCCAQLQTEEGQKDEKCVTTQITTAGLKVGMTGPATGVVGAALNYQIAVTNPGGAPLAKVLLNAKFDPGLESPEGVRELNTSVENLLPGETRNVPLTAIPRAAGRLGAKVIATSGAMMDSAEHFVTVGAASMSLSVDGPAKRYKDRPAEFAIKVTNPGDTPLTNVIVRDKLPAEFAFVSATAGGVFNSGEVAWNLGNLGPRAERIVTLTIRAQTITKAATQSIAASADGGIRKDTAATLEIFGLPALQTKMVDDGDPCEVGKKVVYTLEITNTGTLPADQIEVRALVPPELKISRIKAPARETIEGNQISFAKVDALPPGNKIVYEFEMEGVKAGDARFRVQISAPLLTGGAVIEEEPTTVVAPSAPAPVPPPPPPPPKE
ncbi:MAG: DUF11 domain-containing protein [Gemmataceae bacterium]